MPELLLNLTSIRTAAVAIAAIVAEANCRWRPHVGLHGVPELARRLTDWGAHGVSAATVRQAEHLAAAGVPSVLVTQPVVRDDALNTLAKRSTSCDLLLAIDHYVHAERLSAEAVRQGITFSVLIDIDLGMGRTGCRPCVDAVQLAQASERLPGLCIRGITGYFGQPNNFKDAAATGASVADAASMLNQTRALFHRHGLDCDIVSCGTTHTFRGLLKHGIVTEVQPGRALFSEEFGVGIPQTGGRSQSASPLQVSTDVISRPSLVRAVINCGSYLVHDLQAALQSNEITIGQLDAHRTVLNLSGDAQDLRIGDCLLLDVSSQPQVINRFETVQVMEDNQIVDVWTIPRS